jgi:ribosome-associated translation inhibitor RaiA
MKIQVNAGENIQGSEELARRVQEKVENALANFGDAITRVEAHLSDENSAKGGQDKRCALEARVKGQRPIAVTHQAESLQFAVDGAAEKLKSAVGSMLGRLSAR